MYSTERLTWIPLSERKGIDPPRVIIEPYTGQNYSGYYNTGSSTLVVVDREAEGQATIASIMAHEYRHYVQDVTGTFDLSAGSDVTMFDKYCYNTAIRKYFREQPFEMDALLFQAKVACDKLTKFWLDGLVKSTYNKDFDYLEI